MRLLLWLCTLLVVLLEIGCSDDLSPCTVLPGGIRYCLQTTTSIEPFDVQQRVDIVFNGHQETMIALLETDAEGIRLAGMTPFGQKLMQIGFDNRTVSAETLPGQSANAALLLAVVQLAMWPADRARAGLVDAGRIDLIDEPGLRRIVKDGSDVVLIKYTRGRPPLGDMLIQLPNAKAEFAISNLDMAATQ